MTDEEFQKRFDDQVSRVVWEPLAMFLLAVVITCTACAFIFGIRWNNVIAWLTA